MNISTTQFSTILSEYPECIELLWPYKDNLFETMTPNSFASENSLESKAVVAGLSRIMQRVDKYSCDFLKMREQLIQPNAINVAGYINFTIQKPIIDELKHYAKAQGRSLNINLFPKHTKKIFQNYLTQCESEQDMPDILIGKGFSSLNCAHFVDKFVNSGVYEHPIDLDYNQGFIDAGLVDSESHYHTFGAEEFVMVVDKTKSSELKIPTHWSDLLLPDYQNQITQMGKSNDHFGFVMMFYLSAFHGLKGIRSYARNVKQQLHFAEIVKYIASPSAKGSFINMMHRHASTFIRSEAMDRVHIVNPEDGNPTTAYFFLLKHDAKPEVTAVAKHLFSESVGSILEQSGIVHAAASSKLAAERRLRWVGWRTLKSTRLPYIKEHLSSIALKSKLNHQS